MKTQSSSHKRGFTLIETVIAIGVLALLLTGFIIVFAPAAAGIKKTLNLQESDRLASTLELELVTLRPGNPGTSGFAKAFEWIRDSNGVTVDNALLLYQYRGSLTAALRDDGTRAPVANVTNQVPGKDYSVQSMVRRKSDAKFLQDLPAIEGGVYLVKCTQLVFNADGDLVLGTPGAIANPKTGAAATTADNYTEAVIAFKADYYALPQKSAAYFGTPFTAAYPKFKNPVFTRNLAVRR